MIENRHSLSISFEPRQAAGAEAAWVGRDLSAEEAVVSGKRILLVDDEEPVRACLRMMLELDGHQVTEAGNGAEAMTLLSLAEFDLVLTDFQMPVMEGDELATRIKQSAPSLPIVMITASARARRDTNNPVDVILSKPFTLTDLRCALRDLLLATPQPAHGSVVPASGRPSMPLVAEEPWQPVGCR